MNQISVFKTRLLFILFFFGMAIPALILSFKAYEQLGWETLHQQQLDAQSLSQQINSLLATAINKEESRADTDYAFFVLAGSPEARFVQRSELSKFPIESEIPGVIGYFQIDANGLFSSPILPTENVQTNVYGISIEENKNRIESKEILRQILLENQITSRTQAPGKKPERIEEKKTEYLVREYQPKEAKDDSIKTELIDEEPSFAQESNQEVGQTLLPSNASVKGASFKKIQEKSNELQTQPAPSLFEGENNLDFSDNSSRQKVNKNLKSRRNRLEKNYSPQQSLVTEEKPQRRIEQDKIKINLFESELEPFRFSLLESGHFIIYRQVWRNNSKLIQGAIIVADSFIEQSIVKLFNDSKMKETANLGIYYAGELVKRLNHHSSRLKFSKISQLDGEIISKINLKEPFNQLALVFKIANMPTNKGAFFVKIVAMVLMLILFAGTYFLYRLTLKQSYLVEQQQAFVSSVSHELKTPLTSIRMYGEILKEGWLNDQKRNEYYDFILTESERLSRLIGNVLQISKVSHNALKLALVKVEISELASLIKSKVDSQIIQSGFTYTIFVEPELTAEEIKVDSDAFVQIIINLVDNALKYSNEASKKHIDIQFERGGNSRIVVSVRDFGPGISKKQIKRVFDLFYRTGDEMTREVSGTGIGLALVKELSTAMEAEIEVINRSLGVVFSLSFPRRK